MRRRHPIVCYRTLLAMLATLVCAAPLIRSYQGMATSTRSARPANIQTNIPPIHVDFRDVAVEAGLTAVNVSGEKDAKNYILETTGNGVATFDADGDGLMDIFLANGTTLDVSCSPQIVCPLLIQGFPMA